jgi:hypothetical protein
MKDNEQMSSPPQGSAWDRWRQRLRTTLESHDIST